jgi:hypothetical protein
MSRHQAPAAQQRPHVSGGDRPGRAAQGFKPVALPALRAAVQAGKTATRRTKPKELPPILRKETAYS